MFFKHLLRIGGILWVGFVLNMTWRRSLPYFQASWSSWPSREGILLLGFAASVCSLARALAELTPDGSALSQEALEERVEVVKAAGKCWSVDAERAKKRAALAQG
eukprot:s1461_g11.t1